MGWQIDNRVRNIIFLVVLFLTVIILAVTGSEASRQNNAFSSGYQKYMQGTSLVQAGRYQEAIELLSTLGPGFKNSYEVLSLIGYSYLQINQYDQAVQYLEKARYARPALAEEPRYLYSFGLALFHQGKFKDSERYLIRCQQLTPADQQMQSQSANLLSQIRVRKEEEN